MTLGLKACYTLNISFILLNAQYPYFKSMALGLKVLATLLMHTSYPSLNAQYPYFKPMVLGLKACYTLNISFILP